MNIILFYITNGHTTIIFFVLLFKFHVPLHSIVLSYTNNIDIIICGIKSYTDQEIFQMYVINMINHLCYSNK